FVQLTDADGTPMSGRTVSISKSGQTIATGVTDGVGAVRATTTVTGTSVGTSPAFFQADHIGDFCVSSAHASAALVTDKAVPQITWSTPVPMVFGSPVGAAQLNAQANVAGTFSYQPASGTVLPVGTHTLGATFQPANPANYTGASASTTLEVVRATPSIQLTAGTFTYDGAPHSATATATGATGQALTPVTLTYNGLAQPPVDAGSYTVVASYAGDESHGAASATGTLIIDRATPTVTLADAAFTYDGTPHPVSASAAGVAGASLSPVAVTYSGAVEPPVNAGTYGVVATFAGDANYSSGTATATLT